MTAAWHGGLKGAEKYYAGNPALASAISSAKNSGSHGTSLFPDVRIKATPAHVHVALPVSGTQTGSRM
jgi:hypothetical protein